MHITNDDRPTFELGPITFLGGCSPSRGGTATALWTVTVDAGVADGLPHRLDAEEVFLVLHGAPVLDLAGERHEAGPGDVLVAPAGTLLTLTNPGSEPAALVVSIRAGFRAEEADGTPIDTPPWAA